ncbi:DUF1129 family protein [Weissella tructae]|uniref:Integral membrane protein n=2 Tax=Weissella TaxID=46255 RepID=A0ABN4DIK8_9LACO|nr:MULTISPECIES: DUF1129 family protein [Weissella]AIG66129.1 Putative integral membrane protein [Weissella tructae]AIM63511.1 Putative integral membrane protein [Weissella ceti]AIM64846.1 Putative integral membrane protein [Weissella ceti]ELA07504.1 hypothetical protein WCNC_03572 [Weissella ceti NC36]QVV91280.1 DUF1129 family protein [Weissella tructae]
MEETTQASYPLQTREDFAAAGLSNRNQEFMWDVQSQATEAQRNSGLVAQVQSELLAGQKTGQTARQIFGTPQQALGLETKKAQENAPERGYASYGFWPIVVDNALVFFGMFTGMFGLMLLFSGQQMLESNQQNVGSFGLTALVLTAVSGGLFFGAWSMIVAPRQDGSQRSMWFRLAATIVLFGAWFICYMSFAFIPRTFNPILDGWIYLALAALTYFGFRRWRQATGIQGGFLGGSQRRR